MSFDVCPAVSPERPPHPGEDPAQYALDLARRKAAEIAATHPGEVVIGADTVVTIGRQILGKPVSERDALAMLERLNGRAHDVVTGVAVRYSGGELGEAVRTSVTMKRSPLSDLEAYVLTGEPMDKAGSYAVQGRGGELVDRVVGCFNNVVGLPLCTVARLLSSAGIFAEVAPGVDPHMPA
jgi:septum formation protein